MQPSDKKAILKLINHKKYFHQIKQELLQRIQQREIMKLRRKREFNDEEDYSPSSEDLISTGKAILNSGNSITQEMKLILQNALLLFEQKCLKESVNAPLNKKTFVEVLEKRRLEHLKIIDSLKEKYLQHLWKEFQRKRNAFNKAKGVDKQLKGRNILI